MTKTLPILAAGLVALLLAVVWWAAAGLLATDMDSDCLNSTTADLGFIAAHLGLAIAVATITASFVRPLRRFVRSQLIVFAVLLAGWVAILLTCG